MVTTAERIETPQVDAPAVAPASTAPLVLYDGTCGLCAKSVRWILHHESDRALRFAPLQGETAAAMRARFPNIPETVDSVVYVDGERAYLRSKAFFHMARHFKKPWRWLRALRFIPAVIADLAYRAVAAMRYRIFGKVDSCELPSPENRARFLP